MAAFFIIPAKNMRAGAGAPPSGSPRTGLRPWGEASPRLCFCGQGGRTAKLTSVPRLIVNADDFGLTAGVNRAILELHAAGVLTSATLMARAAATDDAIDVALATPTLGVGCHVVLVDGDPVLPADRIPSLIDGATGRLLPTLGAFLARLLTGRIRAAEIEAEAAAQIGLLQARGLRLTHVDAHKHSHMFPGVLRPVLSAAKAAGIRAARNPFEPGWSVSATNGGWKRNTEVAVLRRLHPAWRRIVAANGLSTTDGALAVAATGSLSAAMVRSLAAALPESTWELVTHPGYNDGDLARVRTRLRGSREAEMRALATLREFPALEMVSFAGLDSTSV